MQRILSPDEREKFLAELQPMVNRGDYKSALTITKDWLKRFPKDLTTQYQHAKIMGDWADELPKAKQKVFKKKSAAILKPLMRRLRGRSMEERFGLCLNYYYQSEDWRGMYQFGRRFRKTNRQKACYAESLGATLLAFDLKSAAWSKKAVKSWENYDFKNESYYFPHYCYAKALALNGQPNEAMKKLKVAARLGQRATSDWEFADVVKLCET